MIVLGFLEIYMNLKVFDFSNYKAVQAETSLGTYDSRTFRGVGLATPGLILSFSIGKGGPPPAGTTTTSISGGDVLGIGYENGGWSPQFTAPGFGVMRNKYSD